MSGRCSRALSIAGLIAAFLPGGSVGWAQSVNILVSIYKPIVTLHEPVYVDFSLQNNSSEELILDLGAGAIGGFSFSVIPPNGSAVQPKAPGDDSGLSADSEVSVAAGRTYTKKLLV